MKKIISMLVAAVMVLGLCLAAAAEAPEALAAENGGLTLSIPSEYRDAVIVNTPENAPDGTLFEVFEKGSVEAAKGTDLEGSAGWIFSVRKVSREELNLLRGDDMSGKTVFAGTEDDGFYLLCTPTDYRFFRQSPEDAEKEEALFRELQQWAVGQAPQDLIAQNGLTPRTYTNTIVDQLFARILYGGSRNFNLIFLEENAHRPDPVDPAPYLEKLAEGVVITEADETETPEGEYIVLNDLESDVRFDFFRTDGNYVRTVWNDGQNQALYKVTFADSSLKLNSLINAWYEAVAEADR